MNGFSYAFAESWIYDDSVRVDFYRDIDQDVIQDLINHFGDSIEQLDSMRYNIAVNRNEPLSICRQIKKIFDKNGVEIKFLGINAF